MSFELHGMACTCGRLPRRGFTAMLAGALTAPLATSAEAAISECKRSSAVGMVPADEFEQGAVKQYRQMLQQAADKRALMPAEQPQTERLRAIARRLIPFTPECNERAKQWQWEVNLFAVDQLNAFCMPGGKIAFFYGILSRLKLDDDEVAMIMGHEMAHALLEHAREQAAKQTGVAVGANVLSALLGLGALGDAALRGGAGLLSLKFGRTDELEADALGALLGARAGYDPRAGVRVWQKMLQGAGGNAPPQWLSTHPSGKNRIKEIERKLPKALPFYEQAEKPARRYDVAPLLAGQKQQR
jgi:Zn-dependent protease with chaperone function